MLCLCWSSSPQIPGKLIIPEGQRMAGISIFLPRLSLSQLHSLWHPHPHTPHTLPTIHTYVCFARISVLTVPTTMARAPWFVHFRFFLAARTRRARTCMRGTAGRKLPNSHCHRWSQKLRQSQLMRIEQRIWPTSKWSAGTAGPILNRQLIRPPKALLFL